MYVERVGSMQVCHGSDGRIYKIEYLLGVQHPWIINGRTAVHERLATLDEAIARAHEMEAVALGDDNPLGKVEARP